jgi:hypothetical protein
MSGYLPLAAIPGLFKHYIKVTKAEEERIKSLTATEVILEYLDEKEHSKILSKVYLCKMPPGSGKSTHFVSALWRHIKESVLIT